MVSTDNSWDENFLSERYYANIDTLSARSVTRDPFIWQNAFNFTNNRVYFGELVMTEEEVEDNMRIYYSQLFYSDIEFACSVSIIDIELLIQFDSWLISQMDIDFTGFCNGLAII